MRQSLTRNRLALKRLQNQATKLQHNFFESLQTTDFHANLV